MGIYIQPRVLEYLFRLKTIIKERKQTLFSFHDVKLEM